MEGPWDTENRIKGGENHQEAALAATNDEDESYENEEHIEDPSPDNAEEKRKKFLVDHCKRRSKCKICKNNIQKDELRIGKLHQFKKDYIYQYHHVQCAFKSFLRVRVATNAITKQEDIENFNAITTDEQAHIVQLIAQTNKARILDSSEPPQRAKKLNKAANIQEAPVRRIKSL